MLEIQVIEKRKRVLRQKHSDMLNNIINLTLMYRNQG